MLGLLVPFGEADRIKKAVVSLDLGFKEYASKKIDRCNPFPLDLEGLLIPVKDCTLDYFQVLHEERNMVYCRPKIDAFGCKTLICFIDVIFERTKFFESNLLSKFYSHCLLELDSFCPPLDFCKYEHYGDFLLLSEDAFKSPLWLEWLQNHPNWHERLFSILSHFFNSKIIARKQKICKDVLRLPRHEILYPASLGESAPPEDLNWFPAFTQQNGVKYAWNPFKTMFCAGNIPEKLRCAKLNCENQVILDLFAGIGYWTLPLLVHGRCAKVYACELSKYSAAALRKNLINNGIPSEKCIVLEGDHAEFVDLYRNQADRVILGYLPSSQNALKYAVEGLRPSGGILSIHENVTKGQLEEIQADLVRSCLHLLKTKSSHPWNVQIFGKFHVKSYGPKIDHFVFDVECRPC